MKEWAEAKEDVREVIKDNELAKSLLKMVDLRMDALKILLEDDLEKFTSIITEGYYEIIKEMLTAIMASDGYKTTSHEALIAYAKEFYNGFEEYEIIFIDELRKIRNNIDYKGIFVNPDFLERNKLEISAIIAKLKGILEEKIKE